MQLIELDVESIGFAAPGLPDWIHTQAVLRGELPYAATELPPYQPQTLPTNERRRATLAVREAFRAAEDAMSRSAFAAADLASVFASSDADMNVLHRICHALAEPARTVSPTDFHNSVHNAAAGYWSIAVGARRASTTIGAYDATVAGGLLEAATLLLDEDAVLLVIYDVPRPSPLSQQRPIEIAVSAALVLTRSQQSPVRERIGRTFARLQVKLVPAVSTNGPSTLDDPGLEALRRSNPSAQILPLLQSFVCGKQSSILLEAMGDRLLRIDVNPSA